MPESVSRRLGANENGVRHLGSEVPCLPQPMSTNGGGWRQQPVLCSFSSRGQRPEAVSGAHRRVSGGPHSFLDTGLLPPSSKPALAGRVPPQCLTLAALFHVSGTCGCPGQCGWRWCGRECPQLTGPCFRPPACAPRAGTAGSQGDSVYFQRNRPTIYSHPPACTVVPISPLPPNTCDFPVHSFAYIKAILMSAWC